MNKKNKMKIVLSMMAFLLVISFSGCSGNGGSSKPSTTIKEEELPGTYKNVGIMAITTLEYTLNDNGTFSTQYESGTEHNKGTYSISDDKKSFYLSSKNGGAGINGSYVKYGDYFYYSNDPFALFLKDEEYGTTVSFDEIFSSNHHSIGTSQWYVVVLALKKDGTCVINKYIRDTKANIKNQETYQGTYSLNKEGDILTLNFDNTDHVCIIIDKHIYYNVLFKK